MSYIKFENVKKIYNTGSKEIIALDNMDFFIEEGEFCIIVGESGAGKTTVLNILGGMDKATEGDIFIGEKNISQYNYDDLTIFRRYDIGFVFQFYNLVQNLTAIENVELATEICKNPIEPKKALELVDLSNRENNFPSQLSGGEQQRVSIARALAKNPKILLCDEPTGALDYNTGKKILELLYEICKRERKTVVVITHNNAIVPMADRVIRVRNGKAISNKKNNKPLHIREIEW